MHVESIMQNINLFVQLTFSQKILQNKREEGGKKMFLFFSF